MIITHPDIAKFCIIRQDYVAITQGNRCAALMLSIFEGYTEWRLRNGLNRRIDLSGDEISSAMCGLYSRKLIMAAGALLDRLDLVRREQKSSCDRTYQYLFLSESVQRRVELATFWDATSKLLARCFSCSFTWIGAGLNWLKALWGTIALKRTMQDISESHAFSSPDKCNESSSSTYIDTSQSTVDSTTTNKAVAEEESSESEESMELATKKISQASSHTNTLLEPTDNLKKPDSFFKETSEEESVEEIRKAIANSPFMQSEQEEKSSSGSRSQNIGGTIKPNRLFVTTNRSRIDGSANISRQYSKQTESTSQDKSSAPESNNQSGDKISPGEYKSNQGVVEGWTDFENSLGNSQITIYERLRNLGIEAIPKVRSLVKKTPPDQLERNILALEELAAAKGLNKPLAAFKAALKDNWQPRNDKQSWWERAADALGRERRDKLIAHVTELSRRVMVCFANGRQIPLDEVMELSWTDVAQLGESL